jgi:hypothetical protein
VRSSSRADRPVRVWKAAAGGSGWARSWTAASRVRSRSGSGTGASEGRQCACRRRAVALYTQLMDMLSISASSEQSMGTGSIDCLLDCRSGAERRPLGRGAVIQSMPLLEWPKLGCDVCGGSCSGLKPNGGCGPLHETALASPMVARIAGLANRQFAAMFPPAEVRMSWVLRCGGRLGDTEAR